MAKKPPAEPRPPGRPTKCTPERQGIILDALRSGNYAVVAAQLADIDEKTFYNWQAAAEEGREPYASFFQSVKKAEAEAENAAVQVVRAGGSGPESVNWQSSAWYLERKFPARYGKRDPQKAELAELDKRLKQLEIETAEAKLALIKRGYDPDDRTITVVIPNITEIEHTPESK